MILANSQLQSQYISFWEFNLGEHNVTEWINDGLMTIFFLLIGLELEREIYEGELSDIRNSLLPVFSAIGGMVMPATLFFIFNYGSDTQSGTGIPTATDIAFAIGIMSLLGNRISASLKIFLIALAMIDDLGAIIIIAIFYTATFNFTYLFISLGVFGILIILNRLKVYNLIPYIIGGIIMWYFMLNSGVHATITGVLLAFAIPFNRSEEKSPSFLLQHSLHKPVSFFILPLFALANTCIPINSDWISSLGQNSSIGILLGLVIGKPLGILVFSFIGVSIGLCNLPQDVKWKNILGVGFLGGIGFTMSIFITLLAFDNKELINNSKIAILVSSLISAIIGYFFLKYTIKKQIN
jgi:NhaA family Na+:H+ antiporter